MWKKAFIRSFTAYLASPFSFHRKFTIELWNWTSLDYNSITVKFQSSWLLNLNWK